MDGIEVELKVNTHVLALPISSRYVDNPEILFQGGDQAEPLTSVAKYEIGLANTSLSYFFSGAVHPKNIIH